MKSNAKRSLILDISRTFLMQVAPRELLTFQIVGAQFFEHPKKFKQKKKSHTEDLLAIGGDEAAFLWASRVLSVVNNVVTSPSLSHVFTNPEAKHGMTEQDSFQKLPVAQQPNVSQTIWEITAQEAEKQHIPREQLELLAAIIVQKLVEYR